MQFIWRNAHSHYVSSATKTVRYGATVFVAIFFILSWYFLIYIPLQTAIGVWQTALAQASSFDKALSDSSALLEEKAAQQSALQEELNEQLRNASFWATQGNLFFVLGLIEHHGLQLMQYEPQVVIEKEWYVKQKVKLSFSGSYSAVTLFFETLSKAQRAVIAPTLQVQRMQNGTLRVQTELCFFEYKKEAA